jgi:hypothetical protein
MALRDVNVITFSDLVELFEGRCSAIRVGGYYPEDLCSDVLTRIVKAIDPAKRSASDIYLTNATPFYNVAGNAAAEKLYFQNSLKSIRALRELCAPMLSPVDAVRLDLEEIWPAGCSLMKIGGQTMSFGIARIWQAGSEALPHQDVLQREIADESTGGLKGQLGMNVYLETAEEGGELEVWDYYVSDDRMRELGITGSYGYARGELPRPSCVISPVVGDLILINTLHVHAVSQIRRGRRTTLSGFVGYWGTDEGLRLWA